MDQKIRSILTAKAGESLIFVLGIMLMLMAIGTSALVAASAGIGTAIDHRGDSQGKLYADSLQRSVMYSLQAVDHTSPDYLDALGNEQTLGGQLLRAIYNRAAMGATNDFEVKMQPSLPGVTLPVGSQITARVTSTVDITPETRQQDAIEDSDGNVILSAIPWQPQTAAIGGTVDLVVVIGSGGNAYSSVVRYALIGGHLSQQSSGSVSMAIDDAGEWRFVSHEAFEK